MINLTPFPIRVGAADATEIPSSGIAKVTYRDTGEATVVEVGGREVLAKHYTRPQQVTGLDAHTGQDVIVPLVVASAMRELQLQHGGRVFTPGMLREEGGIKFAPDLMRHRDLEVVYRGMR